MHLVPCDLSYGYPSGEDSLLSSMRDSFCALGEGQLLHALLQRFPFVCAALTLGDDVVLVMGDR